MVSAVFWHRLLACGFAVDSGNDFLFNMDRSRLYSDQSACRAGDQSVYFMAVFLLFASVCCDFMQLGVKKLEF